MRITIIIYTLMLQILTKHREQDINCTALSDGRYSLQYTFNSSEKLSVLEIDGNNYRKLRQQSIIDSGKVRELGNCIYLLKSDVYTHLDTAGLAGLINRSFGPSCIEITGTSADTIFFRTTYTGNLHITQNQGQLIKIN